MKHNLFNSKTGHLDHMWNVSNENGEQYGTQEFTAQEYLYIRCNGMIDIQLKADYEGLVIDTFPMVVRDEPIESSYALWDDAKNYDKYKDSPFYVSNMYCHEYGSEFFDKDCDSIWVDIKNMRVQLTWHTKEKCLTIEVYYRDDKRIEPKILSGIDTHLKKYVC
jgi:hypothetical protein